jgi:hypothetical protein
VKAEDARYLRSRVAARCQDRRAKTIDHAGRFGAEAVVEICTQHRSERCRREHPSPRIRLAAVVEPLCRQEISVDETRKDHSSEKGPAKAGDLLARSAYEFGKLSSDCGGFGKRNPAFPPIMASWDLSALEAAQQRAFVGASAVR